MSFKSGSSPGPKRLRMPVGVGEARRKLQGLATLGEAAQTRRLQHAAYDLACAIPWAEKAWQEVAPESASWLDEACGTLRRAERELARVAADDSGRIDRISGLREVAQWLDRVAECYRQAAEPSPVAPGSMRAVGRRSAQPPTSNEWALSTFREHVETRGLRAGLGYVVELTDFRHIGLWRFEGGTQSPYAYYDRENPGAAEPSLAEDCSGCCQVRTRAGVQTLDALLRDTKGKGDKPLSYHSVPILGAAGDVLATLCLHDTRSGRSLGQDHGLIAQVRDYLEHTWPRALEQPS